MILNVINAADSNECFSFKSLENLVQYVQNKYLRSYCIYMFVHICYCCSPFAKLGNPGEIEKYEYD